MAISEKQKSDAQAKCFAMCSKGEFLDFEAGCCSVCSSADKCEGWRPYVEYAPTPSTDGGT